jgi:iron complex outermembrane receptor protein
VSVELARDLIDRGDGLTVSQIWTHNDFRFVRDPVFSDNRIAGIPSDVLRTVMTYRDRRGFHVSPSVDWVPQGAFADHANTLKVPGYALFNVGAGIDFSNGVSLFVDARNLMDTRYVSDISVVTNAATVAGGPVAFYPGIGRSVFGGIRAAF